MAERTYDVSLVDAVRDNVRFIDYKGMPLEIRPIPEEPERDDILDPRVYVETMRRLTGQEKVGAIGDLVAQRKRSPKETHPLIDGVVEHRVEIMRFPDRGIPLHIWKPENQLPDSPVFMYIHGGGYMYGDVEGYENALACIAELTGALVVYPEYRFAPECPFPGPPLDCSQAVDWLAANASELGIDISKLAIGGDSAGGGLCNAVVQMQHFRHPVKLLVNLYGGMDSRGLPPEWSYDLYTINPEQEEAQIYRINRTKPGPRKSNYTAGHDELLADPLVSAMCCGNFTGWPRSVIISAAYDYLRYQDEEFALKLFGEGIPVRCIRYAGCEHGFFERSGALPQAEDVCHVIADEMKALFG
ncbi:MAG: alpha/beta hydrolase [Atopobiaceae bacterium]|nr:alpha/beta hydrolase [Atopobiaceae bacterium]